MNDKKELEFTGERMIPDLNISSSFYYEHLIRYFFASQFCKNKNVSDIACGSGYGSYILAKYGQSKKVFSIDISPEAISYAKSHYQLDNVEFFVDNIKFLKNIKDKSIDVFTSFETIEHIKEQELFLKQIKRTLNDEGILIISTPNSNLYDKNNEYHIKELNLNEFKSLLKKYFKNIVLLNQKYFLSQEISLINRPKNETVEIKNKDSFNRNKTCNYKSDINIENSEYFIAICSNVAIPEFLPTSFSINKINYIDFTKGISSFSNDLDRILKDHAKTLKEYSLVNDELKIIKESFYYKFWPIYLFFKNQLKKIV